MSPHDLAYSPVRASRKAGAEGRLGPLAGNVYRQVQLRQFGRERPAQARDSEFDEAPGLQRHKPLAGVHKVDGARFWFVILQYYPELPFPHGTSDLVGQHIRHAHAGDCRIDR